MSPSTYTITLSPAANDHGTAIAIIGTFVRLFALWVAPPDGEDAPEVMYDRVGAPELPLAEMFDDAFTAIARDGAGAVEVGVRLQKALASLSAIDHPGMREEARRHADIALERAEMALGLPGDLARLKQVRRDLA